MSSLTNFLKLFKWDTKTDGSQKFDIDKALNGNWDKTDEAIENAQKTTIETSVAEEITVTDCAGVNAKLDIKNGKTIKDGTPTPDNMIPIRNVGDNVNLFDKNNTNILNAYFWEGSNVSSSNTMKMLYIKCNSNTTYTVQKKAGQRFCLTTTAELPAVGVQTYGFVVNNTSTKLSITTVSNAKYLLISYYNTNLDTLSEQEILDSIKIEQDSIATSYSKYNCANIDFQLKNQDNSKNRIVSFPLAEGQVLHDGDYLDSDGIHQKRKTVKLSELSWGLYTSISYENYIAFVSWPGAKNETNNINTLSNILPLIKNGWEKQSENMSRFTSGVYIRILKSRLETQDVAGFKSWLSNIEGMLEYELAEEIVIPYTTEQEEAYYQLQHLLMYEGYTNISCIDEIKPDIKLTYYYNNLLNKSYAKRFDELEEKIRNLQVGG